MIERCLLAVDGFIRDLASLPRELFRHAAVLAIGFVTLVWFGSAIVYDIRAQNVYQDEFRVAGDDLAQIADSLALTIQTKRGIAATIAQDLFVRELLPQLNANAARAPAAIEELNRFLKIAAGNLSADLIWIIDTTGNTVAASNTDTPENLIGSNYSDRAYFLTAKAGQPGQQYALGRKTNIAGLYFSHPIYRNGRFLGVAVVKWNVPRLSTILSAADAFIVDDNGVVIAARDKALMLRTVPDSTVAAVPAAQKLSRYGDANLRPIRFNWLTDGRFAFIANVDDENRPVIIRSKTLPADGTTVFVKHRLDRLETLNFERHMAFTLLSLAGIFAIVAISIGARLREATRREKNAVLQSLRAQADLHEQMQEEQQLAKSIMEGAVMGSNVRPAALAASLAPASTFNGDLMLAAYTPSGDLHVLVGDFTGHGLIAAIGALPVAEIFRAMTAKGFKPAPILDEINRKLRALLPTGRFLAAVFVHVERSLQRASVINCGMPEAWLIRGTKADACFKPLGLPLGIVANGHFDKAVTTIATAAGDRIFVASDGVTEAVNPEGQMLGASGLAAALRQSAGDAEPLASVNRTMNGFCRGVPLVDDATLVDIRIVENLFPALQASQCPVANTHSNAPELAQCIRGGCSMPANDMLACARRA